VLVVAFTLMFGLSAFGVAGAAAMAKQKTSVHVATPVKTQRAKVPPAGAKTTTVLHLDKSIKSKTDPKSHSVFAVGEHNQLWFMDPTSGWPYTIDAKGYVYTSDPSTGSVYSLGKLSKWSGAAPYFFTLWDYADGSYRVPSMNTYVTIYTDNSTPTYTYDTAYTEVWEYQDYFSSEEFTEETVDTTEETTTEETTQTTSEEHETSNSEEHHEESVAEEHHADTAAEEHHDESAAEEHHDEPAAEEHHDEPAAEEHHDEPAAEEHQDEPDSEEHN
jgi:hypothetical protein